VYWSERLGRGKRSAVGIHGFDRGGFLVEGGKSRQSLAVSPLAFRLDFPPNWRIVLVLPPGAKGLHGPEEQDAFARLFEQPTPLATMDTLCRLVLLGMVPALAERDLSGFGEALYDFNRRVGEMFAPVQGGPYAQQRLAEMVAYIRQQGVAGVGQSSWGTTLFAVTVDEDRAKHLREKVRRRFGLEPEAIICTAACNHGATVSGAPGAHGEPGA
jgi:beta-RFAP synthase